MAFVLAFLLPLTRVEGTALLWTGGAGTTSIYDAGNWSPAQVPVAGDTLTFAGTTGLTASVGSNLTVGSIAFNSTAGAFTINGSSTFTINAAGITNSSASTQTFNTAMALNAAQSWSATSGDLIFNGNIGNNASYLLTLASTKNTTLNGVLSGSGGLTKTGVGTLSLNNANTYTGATTISAGIISIGNNAAFGTGTLTLATSTTQSANGAHTIANALNLGGTLTFTNTDDLTFTGVTTLTGSRTITTSGAGIVSLNGNIGESGGVRGLTKKGTGTLVLGGTNTYTGTTTLSAGTLIIGNSAAIGSGTLSLGAATLQTSSNALTFANTVTLAGNTTFAGSQNVTLNGAATLSGNRVLTFNSTGQVTFNGVVGGAFYLYKKGTGTLIYGGSAANTYSGLTYVYDGSLILAKSSVNAFAGALRIGDNVGTAGSAIVQLNASNQVPDASALTIYTDGMLNLQSFSETVGATTMYGGSVTGSGTLGLNGNLTFSGTGGAQASIDSAITLNADRTFTINDNGNTSTDLAIGGLIGNGSATSAITKAGTGTLQLSGANTFSGGLSINAGTVLIGSSSTGSITSGALGIGAVNLGNTSTTSTASLLFNTTSGLTIANAITARSGGTGTLTLGGLNTSGTNTFTGALTLNRTISVTANTGGEVDLNGAISGAGGITKIGAGTVKLNTANSFTGTITLSSGTLALGTNDALGSGALTITAGTLDFGTNHTDSVGTITLTSGTIIGTGTLTSTGSFAVSAGSISVGLAGTGALTKSTTGTVILSGASTYTGATTITAGTLQLGQANALAATTAVSISSGAILNLSGYDNQIGSLTGAGNVALGAGTLTVGNATSTTYTGIISGSGGLTKTGSGILTMGAVSSYTGNTLISGGTLKFGVANAIDSGAVANTTISSGAILDLNGFAASLGSVAGAGNISQGTAALAVGANNASTNLSGVISGTGSFTKNGTGTLNLSGTNTLSGAVDISAGKILLSGANGSFASISGVTIRSGATLELDNSTVENGNRVGNSTGVTMRGGNLTFDSDANGTTETLGALIVMSGSSTIQIGHNGGTGDTSSITFSSLGTVSSGATVNFLSTGGTLGESLTGPHVYITGVANGTLLGWATVGGDAAEYYLFGVRAYNQYYEGASGININDTTKLVRLSGTSASSAYTLTNSGLTNDLGLNITDIAAINLGASSSNTLNLLNGSLIKSTATATTISGSGKLTAGGTAAANLFISVTGGSSLTISSVITDNAGPGAVGLSKSDVGSLTLSGNNTFSGNVFLNDGVLNISSEANLGAVGNDVSFNGGTLHLTAGFTSNTAKVFSITNGLTGTLDIDAAQTLTLANTAGVLIAGNTTSTLIKVGAGSLVIANANAAFDGALKVSAGTVELQNAQSLGDATNRGTIQLAGGTLSLRANTATAFSNQVSVTADSTIQVDRLSGSGAVTHTLGSLDIGAQTLTIAGANSASLSIGAVNLSGAATFQTSTADLTTGAIGGNFGFTKAGAGALTVSSASTYTGATTLSGGTLRLGAANVLPDGTALSLAAGTTFDLANLSETIASLSGNGTTSLGTGTLTLGSLSSTYSGVISGTGGLTKIGAGTTTTLAGVSTYSGATTVSEGTLALAGSNRLNAATEVSIAAGATLDLQNNNNQVAAISGSGSVVVGSASLSVGTVSSTYSGTISGTGGLTKVGSGTTTLSGDSSYTGTTAINSGIVVARSATALGMSSGSVVIATSAELQVENDTILAAKALSTSGTLRSNSGDNAYTGNITQVADSTIASEAGTLAVTGNVALAGNNLSVITAASTTTTLAGTITGGSSSRVTKSGSGTVVISGSNTYSGTTMITDGTLRVDSAAALGATGAANLTNVSSGATLLIDQPGDGLSVNPESLTINGSGFGGNGALRSLSGDNTWNGAILLASDATIRVDADTLTLSGTVSDNAGARALTKTGSGILILTAAASYTGATNISSGTLELDSDERINDTSAVTVSSGATLDLSDNNETIGSLSGAGNVQTGATGGNTLNVGAANTSTTFSGAVQGSGDVAKVGTGTATFSGVQAYSGRTTISAGTLNLTGTDNTTSGFTVSSGGTLTGTGTTTKAVTVDAGGTLTAGLAGAGALNTGNVNLNTSSTLLVEIGGTSTSQYDSVKVTGTVSLAGDLQISLINSYTPNYNLLNLYGFDNSGANTNLEKYFIVVNDGNDAVVGSFTNAVSTPGYFGGAAVVTIAGLQYLVTNTANSATGSWVGGNDIALIAIPEINTLQALCAGLGLLLAGQRLRRKSRRG